MLKLLLVLGLFLEILPAYGADFESDSYYLNHEKSKSKSSFYDPFLNTDPNHFDELFKLNKRSKVIPEEVLYPHSFYAAENPHIFDNFPSLVNLPAAMPTRISLNLAVPTAKINTIFHDPTSSNAEIDLDGNSGIKSDSDSKLCQEISPSDDHSSKSIPTSSNTEIDLDGNSEIIDKVQSSPKSDSDSKSCEEIRLSLSKLFFDLKETCLKKTGKIFSFKRCKVYNLPKGITLAKKRWTRDDISLLERSMDSLIFEFPEDHQTTENNSGEEIRKVRNVRIEAQTIRHQIRNIFISQHPKKKIIYNNYDITAWPEDVNFQKFDWSISEINKIKEVLDKLIFVEK